MQTPLQGLQVTSFGDLRDGLALGALLAAYWPGEGHGRTAQCNSAAAATSFCLRMHAPTPARGHSLPLLSTSRSCGSPEAGGAS